MPSPRTAGVIRQEFLVHIAAKIQDPQRVTRALKRFWRFQAELGQRWNRPDLENLHRFVEVQKSQSSAVYALRCWLKFLFRQGLLLKPLHEELLARNHRPRRKLVLNIEQMSQLLELPDLETLEGIRDRAALELAYGLGMRSGELVNLNLGDVDFGSGTIHIDCGKNGWARMLPLNRWAAHFLRLYLEKVRPEWVGPKSGVALWISPRDHKRMHRYAISRRLLEFYHTRELFGESIGLHHLRHACATHLLLGGADLPSVQAILGHLKLNSTQVYTQITPTHLVKIHDRFHPRGLKI